MFFDVNVGFILVIWKASKRAVRLSVLNQLYQGIRPLSSVFFFKQQQQKIFNHLGVWNKIVLNTIILVYKNSIKCYYTRI